MSICQDRTGAPNIYSRPSAVYRKPQQSLTQAQIHANDKTPIRSPEPYKTLETVIDATADLHSEGTVPTHRDRMVHTVARKTSTADTTLVLVQNEAAQFVVCLNNTLAVHLRIENIVLL